MVTFLPFKGYRPRLQAGEKIESRISPPYDVIGDEYLKQLQSNRYNVTNLTLSPDADKRYTASRKLLDEMIAQEILLPDQPSFYIYDQRFTSGGKEYNRRGLVGILKTEEYSEGHIIPHEETFSKVKADRLNLLRDMETHLESIFGIFPGLGADLAKKVDNAARLCYRYVDSDGVEHRYSRVNDETICKEITEKLKDQNMLIADGHHRYETALNYAKENPDCEAKQYVLCTMVAADDQGLVVWPTHRLIDAEDIGETSALKKMEKKMVMKEVTEEEMEAQLKDHLFGMIFKSGRCFLFDNKEQNENILFELDTYSAQENILKGIYKSDEGKSKVSYDAELESVKKAMAEKKHDAAIILNDPQLSTIWDLSEKGKRMPKKTTYFFPKIWSGWVFYLMH
ncbi:MAG: DUF1015 domain-containing protein [Candidatus Methanomethylophilus sp.]|nr:DUF1015 domain-containing protein [Methanomethylophilus sp.]